MSDGTVRLWDLIAGKEQASFAMIGEGPVKSRRGALAVAFSPDGRRLVVGGQDNTVHVWDLATGREERALRGHRNWVTAVAISPDGRRLASAGGDGIIRLWDVTTGADACPLDGHIDWIWGAAVSPSGETVATLSRDSTLRLWDVATGRPRRRIDFEGWPTGSVAFAPDRRSLVLIKGERLSLWDAETGVSVSPPRPLADHSCFTFRFTADGKVLVTAWGRSVSIWEWPSGRLLRTLELEEDKKKPGQRKCSRLALAPDGRRLVTLSERHTQGKLSDGSVQSSVWDGAADMWDVDTGRHVCRLADTIGMFRDAAFTSDGGGLLLAGKGTLPIPGQTKGRRLEHELNLLDLVTGDARRTFVLPEQDKPDDRTRLIAMALSPDGRVAATTFSDGSVHVFELTTGFPRRRLAGHREGIPGVVFSPDGKRLVTTSFDNTGLVWDVSLSALATPAAGDPARLWDDLAGKDAVVVNRTLATLATAPEKAVPLLGNRLRPVPAPDRAALERLLADLDNDEFDLREKATAALDRLGEAVVGRLRERIASSSPEARRRLASLLKKHDPPDLPSERVRELRAVEVLEEIGTPEARQLLGALSRGASGARLTREARASLERLARRPVGAP